MCASNSLERSKNELETKKCPTMYLQRSMRVAQMADEEILSLITEIWSYIPCSFLCKWAIRQQLQMNLWLSQLFCNYIFWLVPTVTWCFTLYACCCCTSAGERHLVFLISKVRLKWNKTFDTASCLMPKYHCRSAHLCHVYVGLCAYVRTCTKSSEHIIA